jgi:two-component system response regulator AtoC
MAIGIVNKPQILVVDDDRSIRAYLSDFLSSRGFNPLCMESGDRALDRMATGYVPDAVILDINMPGMSGMEVLERIKQINEVTPVIMLTVLGEVNNVVSAMRMGADDYLKKPFEEDELEQAIGRALERREPRESAQSPKKAHESLNGQTELLTRSAAMIRVAEIARQVADTDVPVLLLGESGVGKEVVARFVHARSERRARPFVKINCAAVPNDLLESELFGYERGAFTGAFQERPGKFEIADKGTLLLDEIGELNRGLQAKLLHVLQDGEFTRLGGSRARRVDVRILAATNIPLDEAIASGAFREDLYFRLNVIRLEIPPLRERKEDIPLLCEYFLEKCQKRYNRKVHEFPEELRAAFQRYDWPGNVRQLENAIKRYVVLPDLSLSLKELEESEPPAPAEERERSHAESDDVSLKDVAARAAEDAEKALVRQVLEESNWNRKAAARKLKVSYKALLNKLKKWRIDNRSDPRQLGLED